MDGDGNRGGSRVVVDGDGDADGKRQGPDSMTLMNWGFLSHHLADLASVVRFVDWVLLSNQVMGNMAIDKIIGHWWLMVDWLSCC